MAVRLVTDGVWFELQQFCQEAGEWEEIPCLQVGGNVQFVGAASRACLESEPRDLDYGLLLDEESHPIDVEMKKQAMYRAVGRLRSRSQQPLRFLDMLLVRAVMRDCRTSMEPRMSSCSSLVSSICCVLQNAQDHRAAGVIFPFKIHAGRRLRVHRVVIWLRRTAAACRPRSTTSVCVT